MKEPIRSPSTVASSKTNDMKKKEGKSKPLQQTPAIVPEQPNLAPSDTSYPTGEGT